MGTPGYKIDQLVNAYPRLKQRDKDFFIATIQDKLRKILSQHEQNISKRRDLINIAQEDICNIVTASPEKVGGNFLERMKKYVNSKLQTYRQQSDKSDELIIQDDPIITDSVEGTDNYFAERDYQTEGIDAIFRAILKSIRGIPSSESKKVGASLLLDAATGSGKSYMISEALNALFKLKEYLKKLGYANFPFRILVLGDKIKTVKQAKGSYVDGYKNGDKFTPPAFSQELIDSLKVYEYHSEVIIDKEQSSLVDNNKTDSITFSTFQTAREKDIGSEFNIVLIAEGHHRPADSYFEAFEKYNKPITIEGREHYPLVITDTATADGALLDLTGRAVFSYPLYKYLASQWAPDVTYHVVACQNIEQKDIAMMEQMVKDISAIKDPAKKHREMLDLKRTLNNHLTKFPSLSSIVDDVLDRIGPDFGQMLVVCNNTKEADEVRDYFAQKLPANKKVMSEHSKTSDEGSFESFTNKEVDVLVTVTMLIEAIDMPQVEHILLLRNMNQWKPYFQILGRGMRGDYITFRDYVGGYANFTRINDLSRKIEREKRKNEESQNSTGYKPKKFTLVQQGIIDVESDSHQIDVLDIMNSIEQIEEGMTYKKADAQNIYDMYDKGEILLSDISPLKWVQFAKKWNRENGMNIYTLPTSLDGLIGLLGGDKTYTSSLRYAKALLQREPFTLKPWAKKQNIQKLYAEGILKKEHLLGKKYAAWAEKMNEANTLKFELPGSIHGLHTTLYRYQRNPNTGADYLVSLLEEKEFIAEKIATKEQIIKRAQSKENDTDEDYIIPKDAITTSGYLTFAKQWNKTKGATLGKIPYSFGSLARILEVEDKLLYIRAALEGVEVKKSKPVATADQLLDLWNKKVINDAHFSNNKWNVFSKERNENAEEEGSDKTFLLPRSMRLLFTTIGGTGPSITRAHTIALLDKTEYIPPLPVAHKKELLRMYEKKEISKTVIQAEKWREFSGKWNEKNSKKKGYLLPLDYKSLITQLGGDYRYDVTKEYGKALFNGEHYIKRPLASHQQLQSMVGNNMFPVDILSHAKRSSFAKNRNDEYSILWLCTLPSRFDTFGEILLSGTSDKFSPETVKKYIFGAPLEQSENDLTVTVIAPTRDTLTIRQQEKIESKEKIARIKNKAKEFRDNKEYEKAYALYYHVRTIDNNDILCKTRINEIKNMGIRPTKQEISIALRIFS